MTVRMPELQRKLIFIAVIVAAIGASGAFLLPLANAAGGDDAARDYLKVEGLGRLLATVEALPQQAATQLKINSGLENEKATKQLAETLKASFKPEAVAQEIEAKVTAAADSGDAAVYHSAAEVLEAERAKVDALTTDGRLQYSKDAEQRFNGRSDADKLSELAGLMAAPQLQAETALATVRLQAVLQTVVDDPDAMRKADDAALDAELDKLFSESRQSGKDAMERARLEALGVQTAYLTTLPPEDVARLLVAYKGPSGQTMRKALVDSFSTAFDTRIQATLRTYTRAIRQAGN